MSIKFHYAHKKAMAVNGLMHCKKCKDFSLSNELIVAYHMLHHLSVKREQKIHLLDFIFKLTE
jgi:hypothetical protein